MCSSSYNTKSIQSLHDLRHLTIIFQNAQYHIPMVLFIVTNCEVEPLFCVHTMQNKEEVQMGQYSTGG